MSTVVAIVPAHNEQDTIEQTLCDLVTQTHQPNRVIVIADNCTDNTVQIVQTFAQGWPWVEVFTTKNNQHKKAGAINQVLVTLNDEVDYVLLMDGDTSLGEQAIEVAVDYMEAHQDTAAVCSRAGVQPLHTGASAFEWLLHRLQRVEYAVSDSQRAETPGAIRCIHGMAALHRFTVLQRAGFYNLNSMVEDYDLTISYKEMGYKTATKLDMKAWTTVPTNLGELWRQRLRWIRGSVDTLREHGWNRVTSKEILGHIFITIFSLVRFIVSSFFIIYMVKYSGEVTMHPTYMIVLLVVFIDILYRMRYVEDACIADYIIRLSLIPELLYNCFRTATVYWSYVLSFFNVQQDW